MNVTAASATLVGASDGVHWSQTIISGNLYVAADFSGENAAIVGAQFVKRIQNPTAVTALRSLEDVARFLKSVTDGHAFSYAATFVKGTILYVVVSGNGEVWIRRREKKKILLSASGTASGTLYAGDLFCLLSQSFKIAINSSVIEKALELVEVTSVAEALTLELHKQKSQIAGTALIISAHNEEVSPLREVPFLARIKTKLPFFSLPKMAHIKAKPLVVVIVLLLALLLVSVFLGLRTRQKQVLQTELEKSLSYADHKYEEGIALVDLNPIRARELLSEAKAALDKEAGKPLDKISQQKLKSIQDKINEGINFAMRSYELPLSSYFQLDLIKSAAQGTRLALYQDVLIILDSENKSLYRLTLDSKASKVLAGGESFKDIRGISVHGEDVYVLEDAIKRVGVGGGLQNVIEKDLEWGNLAEIVAYGGNIYALDTGKNQIWKYIRTDSGFSTKQDYLLFDTVIDLSKASSLIIDGAVWFVENSKIHKFVQGKEVPWNINGLDKPIGSRIDIYSDDTLKNIYTLDSTGKRVIVTDKEGVYLAQYLWKEDAPVTDFVVSEVLKKILLLSRGTIYAIDLK